MPTLTEMHLLSKKMKITVHAEKLEKFSQKHVGFYMKYASFVFRTLRRPSFQKFLRRMLRKENIEEHMIRDVQVRVFPFQRKNGNGLAGNCNTSKGKIQIFPKTLKFCQKLMQKFGKDKFILYVRSRARAALIHELLHLKYANDEEKVRELTKEYFAVFTQKRSTQNSHISSIYSMIFKPKATKNALEYVD
jgi:DNA polymerase III delta prime subunit